MIVYFQGFVRYTTRYFADYNKIKNATWDYTLLYVYILYVYIIHYYNNRQKGS